MIATDKYPSRERTQGIIFSAPMVRTLLREANDPGTGKTQTRRLIRGAPNDAGWYCDRRDGKLWFVAEGGAPSLPVQVGAAPGDQLWVREGWASMPRTAYALPKTVDPADPDMAVYYRADFDRSGRPPWRSPIHMPRWASRLTLTVTEVRVQRLQEISEVDAIAEGIRLMREGGGTFVGREGPGRMVTPWPTAIEAYSDLWNSLHGPDAWGANPWVAAISFSVQHRNIDLTAREAAFG